MYKLVLINILSNVIIFSVLDFKPCIMISPNILKVNVFRGTYIAAAQVETSRIVS